MRCPATLLASTIFCGLGLVPVVQADTSPTTLASRPLDGEFEASHCELFVDVMTVGLFRHDGMPYKFLDVYLQVNENDLAAQGDRLLAVGTTVDVREFALESGSAATPALAIAEKGETLSAYRVGLGRWQWRYRFEERIVPQHAFKEVQGLQFFADVLRATGEVHRLWLRNNRLPFTLSGIFDSLPRTDMSFGMGIVRYPNPKSPIYYQKEACTKPAG